MFSRPTLVAALFVMLLTPSVARAEGLIIPFFGANFGGDSGKDLGDAIDAKRFNWGVSLAFMGAGVIGVEADLSYSPDFYGKSDAGGSSSLSFMGNMILGVPFGGQRLSQHLHSCRRYSYRHTECGVLRPGRVSFPPGALPARRRARGCDHAPGGSAPRPDIREQVRVLESGRQVAQ